MGPPLPTGNEDPVETVETSRVSSAKRARKVKSAGKAMATVFWDNRDTGGVLLVDFLEKGRTIVG